jgi:DNA invertase Pin-like site-specific DNA recombinase
MPRIALYARYSSDNQRDASIEDQLRLCRLHGERQGWTVVGSYSDRAISGASLLRPGIQDLIADAQRGRFDIIVTESIDRQSRDQEDIAGLYKRMRFAGVKIVTLSEGDVSELHIGLKGTMGALYLKDLADKTRRGLRGRIELGKAGGGNCYGYDVVRRLGEDGEPLHGDRAVNESEAAVVRRIFREYAAGKSSRAIAWELNEEGIPGPLGREWGPSTIHGNPQRGNGILNNELYIGKLVWNRQRFIKDPDTGKRVSRPNPKSEWVNRDVPELRIVDQELWEQVKARQAEMAIGPIKRDMSQLASRRRP